MENYLVKKHATILNNLKKQFLKNIIEKLEREDSEDSIRRLAYLANIYPIALLAHQKQVIFQRLLIFNGIKRLHDYSLKNKKYFFDQINNERVDTILDDNTNFFNDKVRYIDTSNIENEVSDRKTPNSIHDVTNNDLNARKNYNIRITMSKKESERMDMNELDFFKRDVSKDDKVQRKHAKIDSVFNKCVVDVNKSHVTKESVNKGEVRNLSKNLRKKMLSSINNLDITQTNRKFDHNESVNMNEIVSNKEDELDYNNIDKDLTRKTYIPNSKLKFSDSQGFKIKQSDQISVNDDMFMSVKPVNTNSSLKNYFGRARITHKKDKDVFVLRQYNERSVFKEV